MNKLSKQDSVNLSLSHGAVLPSSVFSTNLPKMLERAAEYSTGIVLTTENNATDFLAYSDLLKAAERILKGLRQRGLQPQDRVILQLQPRHFFVCLWGCFLGGFVPIPLGENLSGDRAVSPEGNRRKLQQTRELCNAALVITERVLEGIATVQVEDLLDSNRDRHWHQGNLDDLALLLLTSGSTGKSKGVMLSARNLIASVYGMATVNHLAQEDITLNWMPLEHVASLVMFHLTEVYLGCQQIQVKREIILQDTLQWLNLIHQYRVTATWSPNFAYNLVNEKLRHLSNIVKSVKPNWDLSCLRWMGNGAEAVVGKTTEGFLELLAPFGLAPQVISPGYGMTETTSGIVHSQDFYLNLQREFVSVGAPIPGVSLRIVNEEHQVISDGSIGLLQVKGETITAGYYQQPELNEQIFTDDGWFDTGDLGFLESGQLTITGRHKEVIIINGVNYYSHEIESVVEAIAGVIISYTAACGVIDSNQQEQIAVFFHTDYQANELRALVKRIRRSVFTQIGVTPTYIIPLPPETIPKTAIGKIMRSQLSQRFAAGEFEGVIAQVEELFNQRSLSQQELPSNGIEQRLVEVWQEVLQLNKVGVKDNFFELGGNSLLLMQVLSKLTPEYELSAVLLFQYPTIAALANYLHSDQESIALQQGKLRGLHRKARGNKDVAIIGMSCRFPGANNLHEFWSNLCCGVESIRFFSDQEIIDSGVDPELVKNPNYVKASPILDDIENFDANFWGYSPKEAQLLDPQQRLFMECAWESLEDAGYDPLNYQGEIGLYGGAATNTYLLNNIYPHRHQIDPQDDLQVINLSSMGGFQVSTANDKDYLTTRTSYKLNLRGFSVNVQTACSTSLVTVHLACQSLINGESDMALAGGVSVHSPQKMGYLYQEGMILSSDGHCRAFDAEASGTIFGSGAGMVVLKLLDKAIEDEDRIYGIIKGSAVNNDGGTKVGYFAPNVDGQTRVIAEAIAYADILPQSVSYIEAHGTGTKLGDPIEIKALSQAYHDDTRKSGCALGSVKTNVGHLQMASGIVGLIKTTLCLYHQKIPASLHFNQPNPQIDFAVSPFYINTCLQDWKADAYPRRAGVNSLGIGGTNAHVILEEFVEQNHHNTSLPAYLLTLSAKSKTALQALVASYQNYIQSNQASLEDICLTSNIGRHHFSYRQGIIAQDKQELIEKLATISIKEPIEHHKLAFLFTGQGSQYVGMARQLYDICDVFKESCDRCWEICNTVGTNSDALAHTKAYAKRYPLGNLLGRSPLQGFDINQTQYAQPLLFIIEYSLAQLWLSWGIKPDVMVGHSIGEYVAATIAEVFSLEDALKLVSARGKLMQSLPKNGAMLAVFAQKNQLKNLLDYQISIAADNGTHLVLSGLKTEIDNLASKLELLSIKVQLLDVSHAFHSPLMQPMIEEFKVVAKNINYALPKISIVSNLTGELADQTIATANYWLEHILQPVQFAKSIKYLESQQVDIFLEIGTKPTLISIAQSILNTKSNHFNHLFLSSLNPHKPDWQYILENLSQLYTAGYEIDWQAVTQNYNAKKISLPTYPFQRQRYWLDIPKKVTHFKSITKQVHPLLGTLIDSPVKQTLFQAYLQTDKISWLQDHCLENKIIFPGTAYLEIAIALGLFHDQSSQLVIKDINLNFPLYFENNLKFEREIQTISSRQQESWDWEIHSANDGEWQLHCSGTVSCLNMAIAGKSLSEIKSSLKDSELDVQQHYLACEQNRINYGKSFQGIKQLWAKENQALGLIELPNHLNSEAYHFHPALLDACLQILFVALPRELQRITYLPIGLEKLTIQSFPGTKVWSYLELGQDHNQQQILIADVWLYNDSGELIAKIESLKSQAIQSNPAWHSWLYQPQWKPQPLLAPTSLTSIGTWLIFADSSDLGKQLTIQLETQQQQCYLVPRDAIVNNPQAFVDLIQKHPKVTGVIYLWSLDSTENWQECQSCLYLVQALIQSATHPGFWFVTRNAQPVNHDQFMPGISNSCLWGMQKAIALEHPELRCVGIDIDSLGNAAANIFQELCESKIEQVAYRNHQRYVSRLARSENRKNIVEAGWAIGEAVAVDRYPGISKVLHPKGQSPTQRKENFQLCINNPGNLDSLQWQSVNRKQPQDHEIEIEVKATGLNFRDVMVALDLYPDETKFLGLECAGIVTQLGKDVTSFKIGDEVMAIADHSFSQYLVVNSLLAINKPASFSLLEAATIPVTFLTAYYTLVYVAKLQPGEKVLIHAAAGGVGLAAIQIAQHLDAEIYATASTSKWSLLESMGVKQIMNSRSLDFAEEIMVATAGKGVDVVLNSLSGEFIAKSMAVLNDQGRFIEIGKQDIWSLDKVAQVAPSINYSIVDLWQITQDNPELIQQMLRELHIKLHKRSQFMIKTLKPLPYTVFTQEQTIDAFRYMQQGKHQGKIIIAMNSGGYSRITPTHSRITPSHKTYTSTYLITGGMGAIGLQTAQWLVTKGVTNIVLLGRNDIKPELESSLKKIQDKVQVKLIKADIANTNQLSQILIQIESELPPLRGVVHCAGVTSDRTITYQDWHSFEQVLAPKVQGALNLHHLTQKYNLESFILFSSASSLIGSAGQANYCAANAFLDSLAHVRRNLGLPAISINWSAWEHTGLAANTQITAALKQKGIGSIKPHQGIEILEQLLLDPPPQVGVMPINWDLWSQNNSVTPYYEDLVTIKIRSTKNHEHKQQLFAVIPEQRESLLTKQISQQVANILGIKDLSKIDLNLGFMESGLDSLGSVELRNKLQSSYDLKLYPTVMFDYPNITVLSNYLLSLLFNREHIKKERDVEINNNLLNIESLSESQAEALLLEELNNLDL
ncbi:polyketide synthase [Pleurocapsa sp. CCALA 161]|uniref:type I polyketide synthase n=1 Tax=Pleurocapsa sp. CCALA 161 TaxID=2107688 RepID=UPI000D054657|nr:type I polyketide synthase [Pleurocapsa sp. CCALA 161]PSB08743.1 polyketide synthase [Pleurocapsa sp. CCALA 161]